MVLVEVGWEKIEGRKSVGLIPVRKKSVLAPRIQLRANVNIEREAMERFEEELYKVGLRRLREAGKREWPIEREVIGRVHPLAFLCNIDQGKGCRHEAGYHGRCQPSPYSLEEFAQHAALPVLPSCNHRHQAGGGNEENNG